MSNTTSLRSAIDAQCKGCGYDQLAAGNWREQVAVCPSANCPLHAVRPVPAFCKRGRTIDSAAVARIRAKLDRTAVPCG